MIQTMKIPMSYDYKGSSNCYIYLCNNLTDGIITISSDYDEEVAVVTSGHGLVKVLKDLVDGAYS